MKTLVIALLALATVAGSAMAQTRTPRHGFDYPGNEAGNRTMNKLDQKIPLGPYTGIVQSFVYCGQLANNGTIYLGPVALDGSGAGEGVASDAGGTACNALDSATEGTASGDLSSVLNYAVIGMYCRAVADAGTTGSGSNGVTFSLRINDAAPTNALTCTVATGATECFARYATDATAEIITAGTDSSIKAVDTEDLSANDGWCRVFVTPNL